MTTDEAGFDPRSFRRGLGNFATGVTVVTARSSSGERVGVTANSFNSVSLDPPLILWSLDKRSNSAAVFSAASHFTVNILAADQIELSNHFARSQSDKFDRIAYESGIGGAPLLIGCAARFQCERHREMDGGDHWILIGKVVAFDDFGRSPLLYHQGSYSMVLPHPRAPGRNGSAAAAETSPGGRLATDNLYYLMFQAINAYQASYMPKQLSTGLRTSEARMLMMLEGRPQPNLTALQREAAMPTREIVDVLTNLRQKGLVRESAAGSELTEAGRAQTDALWEIALRQQQSVFADVSPQDIEAFKRVLRMVMNAR